MADKRDEPRADAANTGNTGTVSRTLQLLAVLADSAGAISVKQVAESMELAPSTAHRLLQLLRKEGFVQGVSDRRYAIGPQFFRVAARVASRISPAEVAQPAIENLAQQFNETVIFGLYLPEQDAVSFVARADGNQRLKYDIDLYSPQSLVWGASGKVILASLPDKDVKRIWQAAGPSPASGAARPQLPALVAELAEIRSRGYAVTNGEKLTDARGVAAPVYNARGVVGCVCLTSPHARALPMEIDRIGHAVALTAYQISGGLGLPRSSQR